MSVLAAGLDLSALNTDVASGWQAWVKAFWASPEGERLRSHLVQRVDVGAKVYPPDPLAMLRSLDVPDVRVVILGQDPYHGPGQAHGFAFSVPPGQKTPPSLRNLLQEVQRSQGGVWQHGGDLRPWVGQGVMLLNTVLTVEQGLPASHAKQGWERLTDGLIGILSAAPGERVFMLWGAHAQNKAALIDTQRHCVLKANHPSPLSARRGPVPFVGCNHFALANAWLQEKTQKNIDWLK